MPALQVADVLTNKGHFKEEYLNFWIFFSAPFFLIFMLVLTCARIRALGPISSYLRLEIIPTFFLIFLTCAYLCLPGHKFEHLALFFSYFQLEKKNNFVSYFFLTCVCLGTLAHCPKKVIYEKISCTKYRKAAPSSTK
jgi:hypothetical protein